MDAVILLPGEGERIEADATTANMKGPPPHAHRHTTDTFYVLEGTLHLTVGEREIDAPAGSYIVVPPGIIHTFANTSDEPVRFLNINAPGGWEKYLRDLADAMHSRAMPGSSEFAQIVAKYDFVVPAR